MAPEEAVGGVQSGCGLSRILSAKAETTFLPIRFRQDDELVDVLQAPAVCDEFVREEIEQLGMAWGIAAETKIAGRGDEALAEVMMPEAVDDDTSGEWIFGMGDPVGEGKSALGFQGGLIAKG